MSCSEAKKAPGGEGGGGSDEERDDELPTVVVLQKGDIGEEEYHKFRETMKEIEKSGFSKTVLTAVSTLQSLCMLCSLTLQDFRNHLFRST